MFVNGSREREITDRHGRVGVREKEVSVECANVCVRDSMHPCVNHDHNWDLSLRRDEPQREPASSPSRSIAL